MSAVFKMIEEREKSLQSRYLEDLKQFKPVDQVKDTVITDLVDAMIFCKWIIDRLSKY